MESIPVSERRKAQLEALAQQQGRDLADAADDVLALGLEQQQTLEHEAQDIREMLDRRYDDAISGKARLLTPDEARRRRTETDASRPRTEKGVPAPRMSPPARPGFTTGAGMTSASLKSSGS